MLRYASRPDLVRARLILALLAAGCLDARNEPPEPVGAPPATAGSPPHGAAPGDASTAGLPDGATVAETGGVPGTVADAGPASPPPVPGPPDGGTGRGDRFVQPPVPSEGVLWKRVIGGNSGFEAGIAAGTELVYVTGNFSGAATLAETPAVSNGEEDIFVAAFDHEGNRRWLRTFGGIKYDTIDARAAVLPDGRLVAGVMTEARTDFDGRLLAPSGEPFAQAILSFEPTGSISWLTVWAGARIGGIRTRGTNQLVVYDGGEAARYDNNGKRVGDPTYVRTIQQADIDASGSVMVLGVFDNEFPPPGTRLTTSPGNEYELFLARIRLDGSIQWAQSFPASPGCAAWADHGDLVLDGQGGVFLAARFCGVDTVGAGWLSVGGQRFMTRGRGDALVAKLSADDGDLLWARQIGGPFSDNIEDLDLRNGLLLVALQGESALDFGAGPIGAQGGFLATLSAATGEIVSAMPAPAVKIAASPGGVFGFGGGVLYRFDLR